MKTPPSLAMAMQLPHEEDDELSCQKGISLDELSFTDAIYERFCARHNLQVMEKENLEMVVLPSLALNKNNAMQCLTQGINKGFLYSRDFTLNYPDILYASNNSRSFEDISKQVDRIKIRLVRNALIISCIKYFERIMMACFIALLLFFLGAIGLGFFDFSSVLLKSTPIATFFLITHTSSRLLGTIYLRHQVEVLKTLKDCCFDKIKQGYNSSNLRIEKKSFEYLNKKYLSDLDLSEKGISSAKIYSLFLGHKVKDHDAFVLDELKKSILLFSISIFLGLRVVFWLGDVGVGEIFFSMLTYGLLAVVFFKSLNTNGSI